MYSDYKPISRRERNRVMSLLLSVYTKYPQTKVGALKDEFKRIPRCEQILRVLQGMDYISLEWCDDGDIEILLTLKGLTYFEMSRDEWRKIITQDLLLPALVSILVALFTVKISSPNIPASPDTEPIATQSEIKR